MSEEINNDSYGSPRVHHTGAFDGGGSHLDDTSYHSVETVHGEDIVTTSNVLQGLMDIGFDFSTARNVYIPRIVAGIKSERAYRRDCHRAVKELGHTAGRLLYGGIVGHDDAAHMLQEFVEAQLSENDKKVGLELGHVELFSQDVSTNKAWQHLDTMAEEIVRTLPFDTENARHIQPSHRVANFISTSVVDGATKEIKLPRGRTNFPVLDIGKTGIQLFVRVAVGYERTDLASISLNDVRTAHKTYISKHADSSQIAMIDESVFAYPLSATLVALRRNS